MAASLHWSGQGSMLPSTAEGRDLTSDDGGTKFPQTARGSQKKVTQYSRVYT